MTRTGAGRGGAGRAFVARRARLAALTLLAVLMPGVLASSCGTSSPGAATSTHSSPAASHPAGAATPAAAARGAACSLLTVAELASLSLAGPGKPKTYMVGGFRTSTCMWGKLTALSLTVRREAVPDPATAKSFVGFPHPQGFLPGIGDGASSSFGGLLSSITFAKGTTVVALTLIGPGAGAKKAVLIAVAKDVAVRL